MPERPETNDGPIGVFDSGIGGLTVLKEIARALPSEKTIYLGDTARVPYGGKSKETVVRYSREVAGFLSGFDVKMLVVACNTASAFAASGLASELAIPVVGVIAPGARAAARATATGRVAVIGTEGTIRSEAYCRAIKAMSESIETFTAACPLFVPL
ncbi:MAG: glutamate racemase, partial [Thermodesulfobacteriota bacterium]